MTASVLPNSADLAGVAASYGMPPPRFVTLRDPANKTMGRAVERTIMALGRRPMPWQRYVADVGGEVNSCGLFVYPLVIVTVPRQAGKTTLDLAQSVQRSLQAPNRKVWHTAQTGQDARKKWRELAEEVTASPLRDLVAGRAQRSNGAEALRFVNGSILRPHPPTRDSLHGEQSDTNNIDEAWVFTEEEGSDLMQAILPTQLTRPGAQTWIWSTRGDAHSTWFHNLIAEAAAGAPGVALFDFGIPDDADPTDVETIARYHPAVGHTVTVDSLRGLMAPMSAGEAARAFGNRATGAGERLIPPGPWNTARHTEPTPAGRPAYGIAVSSDGAMGALVAAVVDDAGVPWVEVVEHRPGRSWLVDRVQALVDRGAGIAGDRRGPAAPVLDQLDIAGVELLPTGGTDFAAACQDFLDRFADPAAVRVRHRAHAGLDAAADVASRRNYSDGSWVLSRTRSAGDIAPLEAAVWAVWAALRNPTPIPAPFFRFA